MKIFNAYDANNAVNVQRILNMLNSTIKKLKQIVNDFEPELEDVSENFKGLSTKGTSIILSDSESKFFLSSLIFFVI